MAFSRVEKLRTGGWGIINPQVTMGAYLADGKKHKSKQVNFRVSRALINELGWVPEDHKLYITINEGSGSDKGFLQLVPDKNGRRGTVEADSNQGLAINVTIESFKHYILNECPVSTSVVTHMVDGNALIVECPDWLRYNPLSEPQPQPEPKPTVIDIKRRRR